MAKAVAGWSSMGIIKWLDILMAWWTVSTMQTIRHTTRFAESHDYWFSKLLSICRPLTIPKGGDRYFIGEFSKRVSTSIWSVEFPESAVGFSICSRSFSCRIVMALLSLFCLRWILPLLVQMYFQPNLFLLSLAK